MKARIALALAVGLFLCGGPSGATQPAAPRTYTVSAQITFPEGHKLNLLIYRDGAWERIDSSFPGHPGTPGTTTLFDFQTHKIYWIGYGGEGNCSAGRYLSARAPIDQDFVTAHADNLPKTKHQRVGSETVNGIPCRLEEFAPEKPSDGPVRAWIADAGDFVVKLEGKGEDGKPMVVYEVMKWSTDKAPATTFLPPEKCTTTDTEMRDAGPMRAHAESKKVEVKVKATAKFGDK